MPFTPRSYRSAGRAAQPSSHLSLFELNSMVRAVLQHTLPQTYWLTAEINELRVASNGHCYVELIQKDETSEAIVAKARGNIWRSHYTPIAVAFERATGRPLKAGLKVLIEAEVTFHELYGYSLNIIGIDPAYTLGDLAARRQAIIRQLESDGVINLNKELSLPPVISRVAVISSATAAGYGDFCKQLQQSGYQFDIKLFPATMQGDQVEQSVIRALDLIAAEAHLWQVVVIIRGGGSTADLNGFNTYLLAANVAQFPLPVLSGIGHERDETLVDLVAHTRLKTPTAVAAFLVQSRENEAARLQQLTRRLQAATQATLHTHGLRLATLLHRLQLSAAQRLHTQQSRLLRQRTQLNVASQLALHAQHHRLATLRQRLEQGAHTRADKERVRLQLLRQRAQSASPERILNMGYTLTLKQGRIVRHAAQLQPGDDITTQFADGARHSTVHS
ncbi:MAG: exodeoxyribonuclease VII large subunit [Alloprevotella sp.]